MSQNPASRGQNASGYRAHIAGLRAIAVMGVVLFHFGATWMPGGFMGVDVFFVISGFLISRSILQDIEAGRFSLTQFYERRARRILPALLTVTLATSIAAWFILFPPQLVAFAKSVVAAATFSSNIYFYATTNYFSPAAAETPLLHYWSLGVEEQFYLFFPILLMVIWRLAPRLLPAALALMLIASLTAGQVMLGSDPAASFYLLPFRCFELLAGAMMAIKSVPFPVSRPLGSIAAACGLALLLAGFLAIDDTYGFPGLTALLPCLGAALVIWGAERVPSSTSCLLGTAPMRFLGDISYSLYLVHWPVLVFWTMIEPGVDRLVLLCGGTLVSIALGWASFRFVEQPVRLRQTIFTRRTLFAASAAGLALLAGTGIAAINMQGWPERQDAQVQHILEANNGNWQFLFRDGTCFLNPDQGPQDLAQDECLPDAHPDVVIWGSSRIAQFYRGLEALLGERGLTLGQITASSCPSQLGNDIGGRPHCRALNDFALATLTEMHPRLVIIGGDGLSTEEELNGLERTIEGLFKAGIQTVVLGQMVTHRQRVPNILAQRLMEGNHSLLSDDDVVDYLGAATVNANARFGDDPRITFISPKGDLCSEQGCLLQDGQDVLYYDEDHFTLAGSMFYARRLLSLIAPLAEPSAQ